MLAPLRASLLLAVLPLLVLGVQKRSTPSTFQLYAYGPKVGGLPLFQADGYAYAGNPDNFNSSDAAIVTFSPGNDNTWLGNPNTTSLSSSSSSNNPGWSNVTFFVPSSNATSSRVAFLSSNSPSNSTTDTSGFTFYGSTAMFIGDKSEWESFWTGLDVGDGVFALYWNDTSSGQVPLTLRSMGPSNPGRSR